MTLPPLGHPVPGSRFSPGRVALLYAMFAALWIVASGYLLTFTVDDPRLHNHIEIAKGLAFVAVTGGLLYLLLKGWHASLNAATALPANATTALPTSRLVLLLAALALVVPLIGLAIIKLHGPQIEQDAFTGLQSIARLKSDQIENWLAERHGDSVALAADEDFAAQVGQFVHRQADAKLSRLILGRLGNLRTSYGYDSILLFDASARLLLLLGNENDNTPALQQQLRQALTSKQVQRGDLYRDETGHIHLDWVVPLTAPQGTSPVAVVVLRVTAQRFLFPLIQTWPTASPSAETLLVRRGGEAVVFLNELRHRQNTALTLKLPLAEPELPAAIALRAAQPGTTPGRDHRGVAVLAAYRPVPGTDWSIVAKIDQAEVLAPLRELVLWVSLVALCAIAALSAALLLLWRQQLRLQSLALLAQKTRTDRLLQSSFNEIYLFDADSLLFLEISAGASQNLGYSAAELSHLTPLELKPSFTRESFEQLLRPLRTGEQQSLLFETRLRRKDGSSYPVEVRLELMRAERLVFLAVLQDITERKAAEAKILRLSQLYAALRQCNQAIVRCASEQELFPQICRDAVQFGGMKMAWIGLLDPGSSRVRPAASFGDGVDYLQDIEISIDAASPYGQGPTGSAIREQQPFWCQDFMHDPRTAPWRERGARHVWGASAALPLRRNGVVLGALTLYAGEVNAFDEPVRELLIEMATDISFALDNFAGEAARQQAENEAQLLTQRINLATEAASIGIWDWNLVTDQWFATPTYFTMLGYDPDEGFANRQLWIERVHPEDADYIKEKIRAALTGNDELYQYEARVRHADGVYRWVSVVGRVAERDAKGKASRMLGVRMDITERKRAEQELRVAATAFEAQEGIFVTDADNVILRVNQAFTRLTGYSAEDAVGQTPSLLKSGRHDPDFYRNMWESLNRDKSWQGEIWNRYKNGEVHPGWLAITATSNAKGQVTNYIGTYYDLTQSKEADDNIRQLAFYDPLTGLPNRRLLIDRLQQSLAASARHQNHCALLFIDLDNFKTLNDTRGHNIGDLLLLDTARRLQACVREGDTVARLGGDEFIVMLENLSEDIEHAAAQTEAVGEKILAAIRQPYLLNGYEHHCSTSIGISLFRNQELTVDELLKRADAAMYEAKNAGRNALRFYDPAVQVALEARTALENDLRMALAENQFRLHYQMQVDQRGHIHGAEALIRWQHPDRGLVSPQDFISLAEETGLILPIGQWVLETACAQLQAWEADPLRRQLQIAVNVSARQFRQADFVAQVQQTMRRHAVKSNRLKLELTESLVLDNVHDTIGKMQALKEVGVRFSLDDFGTGYSSLSYLTRLPLDQLKIDQSFVHNIGTKTTDSVIVQTIIGMAHNLGIELIAEGVETEQQRAFLERHGCALCQGYLFGRPVPVEAFEASLKGRP